MLWLCNISKIPTLERHLCTSCSDRRHEGALLRLHPVLSNQNMYAFISWANFVHIYVFIYFFDMPWNLSFLIILQYMKKEIQFLSGTEIRSRSGEMKFPNGRLLSPVISSKLDKSWALFSSTFQIKPFNKTFGKNNVHKLKWSLGVPTELDKD